MHNFDEISEDGAMTLRWASNRTWTFGGRFIVKSAWTYVGMVHPRRASDAQTFIFTMNLGHQTPPVLYFIRFERPDTGSHLFFVAISLETGWRGTIKGGVLYTIHCTLIADS